MTKTLSPVAFSFPGSFMPSLYALVSVVSLCPLVEVSLITLSAWVEDCLVINGRGVVLFCLITVSDVIVLLEFVCAIIAFLVVGMVALVFVVLTVWTPVVEAVAVLKRRRRRKKELVITRHLLTLPLSS